MVLATIFYYFEIDLNNPDLLEEIKYIIQNSPLGDETYNASSTNMRNVMTYLYKKNNVFSKMYKSLKYKENISQDCILLGNPWYSLRKNSLITIAIRLEFSSRTFIRRFR